MESLETSKVMNLIGLSKQLHKTHIPVIDHINLLPGTEGRNYNTNKLNNLMSKLRKKYSVNINLG